MNKKLVEIYFSPTYSTQKVVKYAQEVWKEAAVMEIDLCEKQETVTTLEENDLVIVGVPSYGGRVPAAAVERLKMIKANNALAILVCAFGNRAYDDTLYELKAVCEEQGMKVIGAIAAVCEHSIMHQYGTGRPDAEDHRELIGFYQSLYDLIAAHTHDELQAIVFNDTHEWREYHGVPLKPKASNACNDCKLCAQKCPVGAISFEDPKITDTEKCISCMRCIKVCPQNARSVNALKLKVASQSLKKACIQRKHNELIIG